MSLAVIVTYRRPIELARLLDGLAKSTLPLRAVVVVDHAADAETERLVHAADLSTVYLADASNPGPGVGWANGWRFGREKFGDAIERVWFLDDDVVIGSEVHGILVDEMAKAEAGAIAPLLEDNQGRLWGFPEPVDKEARRLIRRAGTPADALTLLGVNPLRFAWCTGACFLVSRQAVESAGEHRADFWMLGEDLEFSMRVATITKAVFTCRAVVPHLPGPPANRQAAAQGDYRKFLSLLQNLAYLSFRSRHSTHMWRYLPGNFRRFTRTFGWSFPALRSAALAFWYGAVWGQPAGGKLGTRLRLSSYAPGTPKSPKPR